MTQYNLNYKGTDVDLAIEKSLAHLNNIDTTPSSPSTKAVTSEGIKTYVDNVVSGLVSDSDFSPSTYTGGESVTLPNGLIMKWGTSESISTSSQATITFGTAFPTACKNVQVTANNPNDNSSTGVISAQITDRTAMTIHNGKQTMTFFWNAIGY